MQCNDCGREIPDWAGEHTESQGRCLNCLIPCSKCERLLPPEIAQIHGGKCINCAIQRNDPNPAIVCGTCHCHVNIRDIKIMDGEVSFWCDNCGEDSQTE